MIRTLSIQGFKSLPKLDIELGKLNFLIGANGAGKSNVLEALGVAGAAAFGSVEPETLRYRGVRPGLPSLYKSSFQKTGLRAFIQLSVKTDDAAYTVNLGNPVQRPEIKWSFRHEILVGDNLNVATRSPRGARLWRPDQSCEPVDASPLQSIAKLALTRWAEMSGAARLIAMLERYTIYSPSTKILREIVADEVARDPVGLSGGGLAVAVGELLQDKAIGFDKDDLLDLIEWAQDVDVVPSSQAQISPAVKVAPVTVRFVDRYMRGGRRTLSAYDASEGALYVLFMLVLALHPRAPPFFAVDNFDQALHPRLAAALTRRVCEIIKKAPARQLLATTHNPLVLDGLNLLDDDIRLFTVDRNEQGHTVVERVRVTSDIMALAEQGMSLSQLWVMGRIGGMPKNF